MFSLTNILIAYGVFCLITFRMGVRNVYFADDSDSGRLGVAVAWGLAGVLVAPITFICILVLDEGNAKISPISRWIRRDRRNSTLASFLRRALLGRDPQDSK